MKQRNKLIFLLTGVLLLLLASTPARAENCRPGLLVGYSGDQKFDQSLFFLQTSPTYGFSTYACPSPPQFFNFQLSEYFAWYAICIHDYLFFSSVTHSGDDSTPSQINLLSFVATNGIGGTAATITGFAFAPGSDPPGALWRRTSFTTGVCGKP